VFADSSVLPEGVPIQRQIPHLRFINLFHNRSSLDPHHLALRAPKRSDEHQIPPRIRRRFRNSNEAKEVDQVEPRVLVGIGNLVVAMLPRSIAFFPYVEYSGRNTAYARMRPKRQTGRDEARRLTNKKFRTRDIDPL
jgi:hypothetical protein